MCCKLSTHACNSGHSSSGNSMVAGPLFWSEKKRVRMVKESIDCLQSQVKDLKEYLRELEGKP